MDQNYGKDYILLTFPACSRLRIALKNNKNNRHGRWNALSVEEIITRLKAAPQGLSSNTMLQNVVLSTELFSLAIACNNQENTHESAFWPDG
ncbi:MAG: hypothetical protein MUO63_11710 [Desulfobulbaceae bacterium]|nr:hypothetical protein [Desulfobulbaceae bacterium]